MMRQILDQLELPDQFGFILRTAGMDRNKAELKRDLAYLQRLWKDMEQRIMKRYVERYGTVLVQVGPVTTRSPSGLKNP